MLRKHFKVQFLYRTRKAGNKFFVQGPLCATYSTDWRNILHPVYVQEKIMQELVFLLNRYRRHMSNVFSDRLQL